MSLSTCGVRCEPVQLSVRRYLIIKFARLGSLARDCDSAFLVGGAQPPAGGKCGGDNNSGMGGRREDRPRNKVPHTFWLDFAVE